MTDSNEEHYYENLHLAKITAMSTMQQFSTNIRFFFCQKCKPEIFFSWQADNVPSRPHSAAFVHAVILKIYKTMQYVCSFRHPKRPPP